MEEDKKILIPEEPINNSEEKKSLPDMGVGYSGTERDKPGTGLIHLQGRIATALIKNAASTVNSLQKEYGYTINDIVEEGSLDREGNLIKLDTMGTRTLISLSNQIFRNENEEVTEYLKLAESESKKEVSKRDQKALNKTPKVNINVVAVSIDLFGKREGSKPRKIIDTYKEIEKISKIKIPQIINEGNIVVGNEEVHAINRHLDPYITITGSEDQTVFEKKTKQKDGKVTKEIITIPVQIEIMAARIFYEHNWIGKGSKHFPLPDGILDARLPSGRAITTDVFWKGLFMIAGMYRYHAFSINYQQVLQKIKKENIIDREKIAQLKEDALTCDNIPIQRIKDIIGFDSMIASLKADEKKAKQIKVYVRRFKEQLWDAMWALIDRGILTDKSDIDFEKGTIKLVYSENKEAEPLNAPGTKKELEKRPSGKWSKNPFSTDKKRKEEKNDQEPDLFPEE